MFFFLTCISYMLTIFYSSRRRCVSYSVLLMLASVNLCVLTWLLIPKNSAVFGLAREMIMFVLTSPTTSQGYRLPWTNEIRYLGIYITKSRQFRCSIDHAKKSFFVLPMQYLVKSAGLLLRKLPWSYWGQNAFLCWYMAYAFHSVSYTHLTLPTILRV